MQLRLRCRTPLNWQSVLVAGRGSLPLPTPPQRPLNQQQQLRKPTLSRNAARRGPTRHLQPSVAGVVQPRPPPRQRPRQGNPPHPAQQTDRHIPMKKLRTYPTSWSCQPTTSGKPRSTLPPRRPPGHRPDSSPPGTVPRARASLPARPAPPPLQQQFLQPQGPRWEGRPYERHPPPVSPPPAQLRHSPPLRPHHPRRM